MIDDDYLWDGSGVPDGATSRIEQALRPFGYRDTAEPKLQRRRYGRYAAIAAAAALVGALSMWFASRQGRVTEWQITTQRDGSGSGARSRVRAGQTIQTDRVTRAHLESSAVGEVEIEPDSRVRLIESRGKQEHFALDAGAIHAFIWAPPREFVVDTPSARTVDLGCSYTLRVNADGTGHLTVDIGWVAFEWHGADSFIPAGAACETRPGRGPGTPYFTDAAPDLVHNVARFDETGSQEALGAVLESARSRDAITLWHLLQRTKGGDRDRVYDRLAALVHLDAQASREAVARGDQDAMDAAWNALGLGPAEFYRDWKRNW